MRGVLGWRMGYRLACACGRPVLCTVCTCLTWVGLGLGVGVGDILGWSRRGLSWLPHLLTSPRCLPDCAYRLGPGFRVGLIVSGRGVWAAVFLLAVLTLAVETFTYCCT